MRSFIAIALLSSALVALPAQAAVSDAAFLNKAAAEKAASNVELQKVLTELTKLTPAARQEVLKNMADEGLAGLGKGKNLLLALLQLMATEHPDDAAAFRDDVLEVLGGGKDDPYVKAIESKYGKLVAGKNATVPTIGVDDVASNPILGRFADQTDGVEPAGGANNDVDFGFGDDTDGEDVLENPNNLSPNK